MAKTGKITAVEKAKKAPLRKSGKKPAAADGISKDADDIFGFFAGKIKITGDIVSPAFAPEEWGNLYPASRPRRPRR
ncbi:MAG: hypothetical protein WBW31_16955 [Candidatus Sulfotelmatobacter sp.]